MGTEEVNMKLTKYLLTLTTTALIFTSLTWAGDDKDRSDIDKRIDASAKVLTEIMATPDKAIPDKIMNDAKCVAVIPSMVKIAVGFGGNHGKGVATCRTAHGWSAPKLNADQPRADMTVVGGAHGYTVLGDGSDATYIEAANIGQR